VSYQPTRPAAVRIGERRRPEPNGRPGYLRVDTVHQGDSDGIKGVYQINAVDEVRDHGDANFGFNAMTDTFEDGGPASSISPR
jgi:hypothetical protein